MLAQILSLSLLATSATAHFGVNYPEWRGDSFEKPALQYTYPCANVNQTNSTKRTEWPLTGGSVSLDLHHKESYVFINLGIGTEYPSFNYSLTVPFLNETGNGTFCLPKVTLPSGLPISEGTNASIQFVTVGDSGTALYNCADITFTSKAQILGNDTCTNTTGVSAEFAGAKAAASLASGGFSGSMIAAGAMASLSALAMSWLL